MPPNPKQDRIFLELARRRGALDAKGVEALQAQALREQKTLLEAAVSSPSIPAATADGILSDLERLAFTCKKCGRGDLAEPTDRPGSRELCEACSPAKRPSQRLGKATGATPLEGPRKIEAPSGTSAPGPGAPGSGAASATAATGSASDSQRAPPPPSGSVVKRPTSSLARSSQSFKAIPPASGSASAPSAPASAPSAPAAPAPGAPSGSAAPPEPSLRGATSVAPASSPGPPPPTGRASQRLLERFASSPSSSAGALEPPRRKTFSLSKDSQAGTALPPQAPPPGARAAGEPAEDAVFLTHMTDAPAPSSARTETAAPPDASPGEVFLTQAGGEPEAPKTTDAAPVAEKGPGEGDVFLDEIGGKAVAPSADAPVSPNAPVRGSAKKSAISSRRTGIFAGTLGLADEPARNAADPGAKAPALLLDDVDMAGAVIGGCRIERLLGKGAMARVYVAHDPKLDRKTAIKILDEKLLSKPGFADQFVAEARTLAKLDHPNIVRVHTVDKDPSGAQFIVMELLEGGSVEALWKKSDKRLPIDEAVRIIREAAEGLFHAHRAGLIHRDVKPANLMLTKDKRVKVVDFGLAVPTQGDVFVATGIAGTPVYMAPEQADGLRLDARCDQYSLGVTLYQLLCGRPPFEGKRGVDVLLAHATAPPVPPHELRPDIPPWLEKGLLTMLAKAPSARFPSLGDVVRLFQGQRAPTQELPPPVPARPAVRVDEISGLEKGLAPKAVAPPRWRPALLALAACAAVLVVFFLGPGRVALGSAASRVEASPVVAKALKHSQELAASQKPQDLVLALKQLEDDIADLGARARAGALETERQAVKEKLDGIRKQTEKDLKEKVALLVSRDRFAAAIDAADPEDKALVALDLAPLAGELRAEAVKALASMRNEVYVKGGAYFTGQEGQAVLKGFYIDRTEVTNETWAKAVGKPGVAALASWRDGQPLPGTARQPVANVTFEEATRFAQAIGKRLPSTEEWEKAARGDKDARPYPWGERFEPGKAHLLGTPPDGLEDADARQNDASPYDVLGLAGNAAEWVTGAHGPLVAGGGYRSHERSARVFARMAARPETRDPGLGFRCARDVEPPDAPARGDEKK